MAQERRADKALDGRQRRNSLARSPLVALQQRADRLHAPHRSGPRTANGEELNQILQCQHSKDGLERVAVDAHRRRDMRGGRRGMLSVGVFLVSCLYWRLHAGWRRRLFSQHRSALECSLWRRGDSRWRCGGKRRATARRGVDTRRKEQQPANGRAAHGETRDGRGVKWSRSPRIHEHQRESAHAAPYPRGPTAPAECSASVSRVNPMCTSLRRCNVHSNTRRRSSNSKPFH